MYQSTKDPKDRGKRSRYECMACMKCVVLVYVKGMYEGMLWLYQSTKDPKDRGKRSKYECISSSGTCADNPTCRKRKHGKKGRDRGWKT